MVTLPLGTFGSSTLKPAPGMQYVACLFLVPSCSGCSKSPKVTLAGTHPLIEELAGERAPISRQGLDNSCSKCETLGLLFDLSRDQARKISKFLGVRTTLQYFDKNRRKRCVRHSTSSIVCACAYTVHRHWIEVGSKSLKSTQEYPGHFGLRESRMHVVL